MSFMATTCNCIVHFGVEQAEAHIRNILKFESFLVWDCRCGEEKMTDKNIVHLVCIHFVENSCSQTWYARELGR